MIQLVLNLVSKFSVQMNWLQSLAIFASRLWIANIFFKSGLVKIKSWSATIALFEYEYAVPLLPPEIAAYMGTAGELILPVLVAFGLFTPFAALGLFIMSLVIEIFVYPGTTDHYYWLLLLGMIATHGSGKIGLDHWLLKKFKT